MFRCIGIADINDYPDIYDCPFSTSHIVFVLIAHFHEGQDCISQQHTISPVGCQTLSVSEGVAYCLRQLSHYPCFRHKLLCLPIDHPFLLTFHRSYLNQDKIESLCKCKSIKLYLGSHHIHTIYVLFCLSAPLPFVVSNSVLDYI